MKALRGLQCCQIYMACFKLFPSDKEMIHENSLQVRNRCSLDESSSLLAKLTLKLATGR